MVDICVGAWEDRGMHTCMHGCMGGWVHVWCMGGWIHALMHGRIDACVRGRVGLCMDAWKVGCMLGCMEGWMQVWMHAWMLGWERECKGCIQPWRCTLALTPTSLQAHTGHLNCGHCCSEMGIFFRLWCWLPASSRHASHLPTSP